MDLQELEAKVKTLEDKVRALEDIEQIEKLQRIYGYYFDNRMFDEVVDLFSDDIESVEISNCGVYLGKNGAKRMFKRFLGGKKELPGALGLHMQLQGVVDVDPGGKTAKGRWRCFYCVALPVKGELRAMWGHGEYENEYIKEDGKWKFTKLHFFLTFRTPYEDGWVKTPVLEGVPLEMVPETLRPDKPSTVYKPYPSGYIFPFHFKHPITGK
jgi:hypothetical protein